VNRWLLPLLCSACGSPTVLPSPFPEPDAWRDTTGPGGPARTFTEEELFVPCAFLTGGPEDIDHHNLVVMFDGHLILPWAPEDGGGGLTLFDVSDPCAPVKVGEAYSPWMRESHALGISEIDGRTYVAVDYLVDEPEGAGGIAFWEITDPTSPTWVGGLTLPGHDYPDSYTRLTLSVTWQGDYLFASTAVLGVFVIDASNPHDPQIVDTITFDGIVPHLVGSFHVWGNTAMASAAGLFRTVLVDVSDPLNAVAIPGGDFEVSTPDGDPVPYYFSNLGLHHGLFARSDDGGGPVVYDLTDPSAPTLLGGVHTADGDGGYIFQHEDRLFVGDSNFGSLYDFTDPAAPTEIGRFQLKGDLDTVTPVGNVAVVSVDEKGDAGQSSAVMPWRTEPDTRGPISGMTSPVDGARFQALTSRVGVVFDEMIEPKSAFTGSFRVTTSRGEPVAGRYNVQENVVNFTPDALLLPDTTYVVHLPAGGLSDISGNAVTTDRTWVFTTGDAL
jgi:hypothetical protein